jgi:predicted RNase H-like nuclease (RuvC/YqgF family)
LPDENKQDLNPTGEELEGLIAEKDKELAVKDLRISELEQAIATRDNQIAALKQSLAELELKLTELNDRLSQAVSSYRAQVIKLNPGVPEELITGDSIEAIDKSLEDAQNLVGKVRKELEAEIAGARVPAGAPQRTPVDLSALSPKEKIQYAIGERR